jgi:glycerophosphoryl diester phosphodiesterase
MNAFLQSCSRPLNLAHRGASAHAPENTLAAFRLAADQGADGIEFDAKVSRDGVVVILHDATVDRTTGGTGRVSTLLLAELKHLDAGAKFNSKFAGERIPTLEEIFDAVSDRLILNIELTNYASRDDGLELKVIDLVARRNLADRVMVSSFNPLSLRKVKQAAPHIACGLLYSPDNPIYLRQTWGAPLIPDLEARHPEYSLVDADFVRTCHARGQKVNVWTVNEEADMRRMIGAGVDAIMTDRPFALKQLLAGS